MFQAEATVDVTFRDGAPTEGPGALAGKVQAGAIVDVTFRDGAPTEGPGALAS